MTIQRAPKGLLDLLAMKGTGDLPHELSETLSASVDVMDLYLNESYQVQTFATLAIAAAGFAGAPSLIVPQGEYWLLKTLSAQSINLNAGESYRLRNAILVNNPVLSSVIMSPNECSASGVLQRIGLGWYFEVPLLVRPADQLGVWVNDVTAGVHGMLITTTFYRLSI